MKATKKLDKAVDRMLSSILAAHEAGEYHLVLDGYDVIVVPESAMQFLKPVCSTRSVPGPIPRKTYGKTAFATAAPPVRIR